MSELSQPINMGEFREKMAAHGTTIEGVYDSIDRLRARRLAAELLERSQSHYGVESADEETARISLYLQADPATQQAMRELYAEQTQRALNQAWEETVTD